MNDIFWDLTRLDDFQFPDLHKAYLGLTGSFEAVLSSTPQSDIDIADVAGRTVLSWAARRGDDANVARLLSMGADPNKIDSTGIPPLYRSLQADSINSVDLLVGSGANVNAFVRGTTMLHWASGRICSPQVIRQLVKHGAELEAIDRYGNPPMLHAIAHGDVGVVYELLRHNATVSLSCVIEAIGTQMAVALEALIARCRIGTALEDPAVTSEMLLYAARYADIPTLDALKASWPRLVILSSAESKSTMVRVLDWASYRRDHNSKWARRKRVLVDPDPQAWYDSFQELNEMVQYGCTEVSCDEDGSENCTGADSNSGVETGDEYQDAQETL